MPITTPKEMFDRAYKEGYAIGAFNVNNMEIIQGIMEAGAEERSPLILQVSAGARKYTGEYFLKITSPSLSVYISSGSPSRIRIVLRISFGITTRPRSSILRTIPVAFIYIILLYFKVHC